MTTILIIMLEMILIIITSIMLKIIIYCNELALDHRRSQCEKINFLVKHTLSGERCTFRTVDGNILLI